jgi:hypothetical protein
LAISPERSGDVARIDLPIFAEQPIGIGHVLPFLANSCVVL